MTTWILLLRGINVGGKNRLPMDALRQLLQTLQVEQVETYIQSGNAVVQASDETAAALPHRLPALIEQHHGFRPEVWALSKGHLEQTIASNPFPEAEPNRLHVFFLDTAPAVPDLESLDALKVPSERFALQDEVFYLHAPEGIGRSKLAAQVERSLGVRVTARNGRTVAKLWEMANAG